MKHKSMLVICLAFFILISLFSTPRLAAVASKPLGPGVHTAKGLGAPGEIKAIVPPLNHLMHPNDPFYPLQWGLNNIGQRVLTKLGTIDADIDAPQAWEHGTDCGQSYSAVIVAVIDTGADLEHPDLNDNIWYNRGEFRGESGKDDDVNWYTDDRRGWNFAGPVFIDLDRNGIPEFVSGEDIDGDGHFDSQNEDADGDGVLDGGEDLDHDHRLDEGEDVNHNNVLDHTETDFDGDGHFDAVNEDTDHDGVLDTGEDLDHDGRLDLGIEDLDRDGHFDSQNEDADGDGHFDSANEDRNHNGILGLGEDLDHDGRLDTGEDLDGDGNFDTGEDADDDGSLDLNEDLNGNRAFDNDPWDHEGHGTHVAGIVGARGDNGIGVAGVCWIVRLMILRAITVEQHAAAIRYAVRNGAKVVNLSWGGPFAGSQDRDELDLYQAVCYADQKGALVVCAAGNEGNNNDLNEDGEDVDRDGRLDTGEDVNHNDIIDSGEDRDGDGQIDATEDLDGDGHFDNVNEDNNRNYRLDSGEDLDGDERLDRGIEDIDGDGRFDWFDEDTNRDYRLNAGNPAHARNGSLDPGEDLDGDGELDSPHTPASLNNPNIIAVAMSDCNDYMAWANHSDTPRSNYGNVSVDFAAPGDRIYSTMPRYHVSSNDEPNLGTEDIDNDRARDITEDLDGDGNFDNTNEDTNFNGALDAGEDLDHDGHLDMGIEDIDGDGHFDNVAEDADGDGALDTGEDVNHNGVLDEGEDRDGDRNLDGTEDLDGDSHFDTVNEDVNGDGDLDVGEDQDHDGRLDLGIEDIDNDGHFDTNNEDLDRDGRLNTGEDADHNGRLGRDYANDYDYMSGTSMAAPFVSGSITHFWTLFPALLHLEVREWILYMQRVDWRPAVGGANGRVRSGLNHDGRLRMICGDDFGDAPDPLTGQYSYPTKNRYNGASHEDIGEEWLGFYGDVTPEFDADVDYPWDADPDRLSNIQPSRIPPNPEPPYIPGATPNLERYDDGVKFFNQFLTGHFTLIEYSICTENEDKVDFEGGRYQPGNATTLAQDKRLYINIWIDWNIDGDWNDAGEHAYSKAHDPTREWNRTHCSKWRLAPILVPWNAKSGETWLRARLDYGEDVRVAKYDSDHTLRETEGLAQFGEVEDYPINVTKTCPMDEPTEWLMFGCDPTRARYSISPGPCSNNTLWIYTAGGPVTSPAAARGKAFVGSVDRNVYAIDGEKGTLVWNYTTGSWVSSTPAIVNATVFVGSWDGNLYALDADSGQLRWNYTTRGAIPSSPAVVNSTVFVGSTDGSVYALRAETGTLMWRYVVGVDEFDQVWSSPAFADGKVFFGSLNGVVYALDAKTGNRLWSYNTSQTGSSSMIFSSPAAVEGRLYIGSVDVLSENGTIYCLNTQSGKFEWRYETGGIVKGSPAVTCGKVFIGSYDGNVYALNATTGALVWKRSIGAPFYSSPAVACKQKVYIASISEDASHPSSSFTDPARDLYSSVTGQPIPPEKYLPYMDVVQASANLTDQALEFSITLNGGIPPLNYTTLWMVMIDSNDYLEDNSPSDVDRMYYVFYESTTAQWGVGRMDYFSFVDEWWTMPSEATWAMISAYPDGHVIMQISIPLEEIKVTSEKLLPQRIPWNVMTYEDSASRPTDLAPDEGQVSLGPIQRHGVVYSLDAQTGAILWTYETAGTIESSPAIANGTLFIGSDDGRLYAFRSSHNVSIAGVESLKTVTGLRANITVTVKNCGDLKENFELIACANSTIIQELSATIDKGTSGNFSVTWDTTSWAKGNYTIEIYVVSPAYYCNASCGGKMAVLMTGDITGDGKVNILDIFRIARVFGSNIGYSSYEPNCDINFDGTINISDIVIAALNFGKIDS